LGLSSRGVWLYSSSLGFFQGHTFNEVFNPTSHKWEIHDVDYNVYFVNARTGERAGVSDMLEVGSVENFVPINASSTGWAETGAEALRLANFFAAPLIPDIGRLYTNPGRVTPELFEGVADALSGIFDYEL